MRVKRDGTASNGNPQGGIISEIGLAPAAGFADGLANQCQQGVGVVRLVDKIVATGCPATPENIRLLHAAENNHRYAAGLHRVGQTLADREPVHVGKTKVQQDKRRSFSPCSGQSRLTRVADHRVELLPLQSPRENVRENLVIIDDQNRGSLLDGKRLNLRLF